MDHLIVSHHGELEFGSPKVPLFPEALLLHHLDNLDSKMEAMRSALKRDALAEGDFTGWVPALERPLLRKDRYLADAPIITKNWSPSKNRASRARPRRPHLLQEQKRIPADQLVRNRRLLAQLCSEKSCRPFWDRASRTLHKIEPLIRC